MEPKEVVHMMLVTQYLDVLKDFAQSGRSSILVPHGPSAVGDMEAQVRAVPFTRSTAIPKWSNPLTQNCPTSPSTRFCSEL